MSLIKLLKTVDNRSKDSVFGYIRQSRDESKDAAIPTMIQYCCLKYYFINEYFSKCCIDLRISNNGRVVKSTDSGCQYREHSAFGNIIVNPSSKCITEYKWTVKLLELTGGGYFGLNPLNCPDAANSYGLGLSRGSVWGNRICQSYSTGSVKNDIISMVLNVKNKTLSFHRNGKDLGNINCEIDMNRKYRMSVTFYKTDSCAQLLKYEEKYE